MNDGNSAMSGHSHGRLGQPPNTWNHLQVPSYIPRQPQLAHLSNERPMTWHTPTPPPTDTLYNFMAANHKNPLDLNPMVPTFASTTAPFSGTMDLTVSTRNSGSPRKSPAHKTISPNPSVIQSVPKEKNNGELSGTLFVRDAKQINNSIAEPVELVKEALFKNHAPKCNSPVQPPAPPTRQSPAPSVSPPVINQPSDLSSASTGHEVGGLTVPSEENAQVSPKSVDSVDSGGRKRRKRKPNKTTRMENQEEEVEQQFLDSVPCPVELARITEPPVIPVSAIQETRPPEPAVSPGKMVDSSPKRRSRRKGADDAEPVETIDMIANTEEAEPVAEREIVKTPESSVKKGQENGDKSQEATNANFDEVENKLEQMFAGIDDRPAPIPNSGPDETPSGSKTGPKPPGRKRALSKDEDMPKPPKKRKRGRKPGKLADKVAVKRKKGRPRLKPPRDEVVAASATETSCSTPRFRGPYVQVRGSGVACVINTPQTEEEGERGKGRGLHSHASSERRKIRGLHVSTLSTKYDADTTDATWMCVFCKYGPHKMGLGDLFGPYTVSTTCEEFQLSQMEPAMDDFKSKRTKGTMIQRNPHTLPVVAATTIAGDAIASTSSGKKKKKAPTDEAAAAEAASPDIFVGMGRLSEETLEVWLHEDCTVWAPGVHIIGSRLVGLEATVWGGTRHVCALCGKNGATIGCLERGCREMIHVPCARQSNWILSDEDLKSHCVRHASSLKVNGQA